MRPPTPLQQAVFIEMRRAADEGLPCPSNMLLAEITGAQINGVDAAIRWNHDNGRFCVHKEGRKRCVEFGDGAKTELDKATQYPP